jgi:hypothetical protein
MNYGTFYILCNQTLESSLVNLFYALDKATDFILSSIWRLESSLVQVLMLLWVTGEHSVLQSWYYIEDGSMCFMIL